MRIALLNGNQKDGPLDVYSQIQEVDRIIFCVFLEVDFKIYKKKMSEFFPVDGNKEEDVDMKEDSDENGPEEKQSAEDVEGHNQEADGVSAAAVPSPASEKAAEVCKDQDSAKDDSVTKESEVTDHSVGDQDHPNGQENDSMKNEIKIEAEPQISYMETEELSSNQDATTVEKPEVIPLTNDQEEKDGGKGRSALKLTPQELTEFLWIPA
ncbi:Adp-Ribose Glycohydrolase Macrod2 [Manis pentadactyla]|nr:Adp-Ribose Glycohydrolase Macrod2 [Manis pentadactyla]